MPPLTSLRTSVARRLDSIANALTGLGTAGDKARQGRAQPPERLRLAELTWLYEGNGYCTRVVDVVADDATRKGWAVTGDDRLEAVSDEDRRLRVQFAVGEALRWARLYGYALVLPVMEGGNDDDLASPLDPEVPGAVGRVVRLVVLDALEAVPLEYETDPRSRHYRRPRLWSVTPSVPSGGVVSLEVHADRVIYVPGRLLPPSRRHAGTDASVLQAVWDLIRSRTTVDQAVAVMAHEMKTDTLKIAGLANLTTGAEVEEFYRTKVNLIQTARSILNMTILDEGDELTTSTLSATGVKDIDALTRASLAAVAGIPQTLLFGDSPGGLNADGESGRLWWYAAIGSVQERILRDPLEYLYTLILAQDHVDGAAEGDGGDGAGAGWSLTFRPLESESNATQAVTRKTIAETDAIYVTAGVYTAEHVARSRFGDAGYQTDLDAVDLDDLDGGPDLDDPADATAALEALTGRVGAAVPPEADDAAPPPREPATGEE